LSCFRISHTEFLHVPADKQGDKTKSKSSTKKENKLRDVEVALQNIDAMIEREKLPNVVNFDSMDQNISSSSLAPSLVNGMQVDKNVITDALKKSPDDSFENVITETTGKSVDFLVAADSTDLKSDALTDKSVSDTSHLKSSDIRMEGTAVSGDSDEVLVSSTASSLLSPQGDNHPKESISELQEESDRNRKIENENENNQALGTAESSAKYEQKMKKIKTVSDNYSGLSDFEQKKEFCRTCREIEELSPASSMQLQPRCVRVYVFV
jgi:hypothetical protein